MRRRTERSRKRRCPGTPRSNYQGSCSAPRRRSRRRSGSRRRNTRGRRARTTRHRRSPRLRCTPRRRPPSCRTEAPRRLAHTRCRLCMASDRSHRRLLRSSPHHPSPLPRCLPRPRSTTNLRALSQPCSRTEPDHRFHMRGTTSPAGRSPSRARCSRSTATHATTTTNDYASASTLPLDAARDVSIAAAIASTA